MISRSRKSSSNTMTRCFLHSLLKVLVMRSYLAFVFRYMLSCAIVLCTQCSNTPLFAQLLDDFVLFYTHTPTQQVQNAPAIVLFV